MRHSIKREWFEDLGNHNPDLARVRSIRKRSDAPSAHLLIPPFRGISREPLKSRAEASDIIGCSLSFLDKQVTLGMIHPQPRGSRVMIPIEEIENFNERSRLVREEKKRA
jgi:hypothetical protein